MEGASKDGLDVCFGEGTIETTCSDFVCDVVVDNIGVEDGSLMVVEDVGIKQSRHRANGKTCPEVTDEVRVIAKKVMFVKKEFESMCIIRMNNFREKVWM